MRMGLNVNDFKPVKALPKKGDTLEKILPDKILVNIIFIIGS